MGTFGIQMEYRFAAGELRFGDEGKDDVWRPPGDSLETDIRAAIVHYSSPAYQTFNTETRKLAKSKIRWEKYEYKALFFLLSEAMTSRVEGVKKSRKSQIFRGVNKIYSFKALKTRKAQGTIITLT